MNIFHIIDLKSDTLKTLLSNFTYLSILEVIGILFPLVTYPYLIRVIGAEKYGVIVFSQSVVAYITIVVNFGFNVSATRRISENRDDKEKLCIILSSVTYLKILMFLSSILLAIPILYLVKFAYINIVLLLLGLCIQEILFPVWFFQGIEKMQFITFISFLSKLFFLILIFLLVRDQYDFWKVPLFYSLGGIVTTIASIVVIKKYLKVRFVRVSGEQLKMDFKESLPFFASRLSSVIMDRTNVILIGSFFSYEMVSVYDLCAKVISIMKVPYSLVAQVLYPNVAKSRNMTVIRRAIAPVFGSSLLFSLVVCFFAYFVVSILGGEKMLGAVDILRMMVWYIPISGMSLLLGASTLVVNNHAAEYNKSVIYAFFVYMCIIGCLVLAKQVNLFTMVFAFIIPELVTASYRIYKTHKFKLLRI